MKTSVVMIREMGNFVVEQRSKDGLFNATGLLRQWNVSEGIKRGKEINGFLKSGPTQEFVSALKSSEKLNTNQIVITKRGKHGGTWMHPYLFMDFAMWLNPTFKVQVIKFVHDQLIEQRNFAGDNFRGLASSASTLPGADYRKLAKGLNWIVFGRHKSGIRQIATQSQLAELNDVQKKLAFSIDMGMINTFDQLIGVMKKMYLEKQHEFSA